MNTTCSVYIATSLDGFIARADGNLDWLHRPEYAASGELASSFETFLSTVDALVMGRHTFETVLAFDTWPFEGKPVVVLSSRVPEVPDRLRGKVRVEGGPPRDLVARLAALGYRRLYVDGGVTIQRFLQAGLIDEMTITRIPVLLGGGIPLFGTLGVDRPLRLLASRDLGNGLVRDRYEVVHSAR